LEKQKKRAAQKSIIKKGDEILKEMQELTMNLQAKGYRNMVQKGSFMIPSSPEVRKVCKIF